MFVHVRFTSYNPIEWFPHKISPSAFYPVRLMRPSTLHRSSVPAGDPDMILYRHHTFYIIFSSVTFSRILFESAAYSLFPPCFSMLHASFHTSFRWILNHFCLDLISNSSHTSGLDLGNPPTILASQILCSYPIFCPSTST